MVTGAILDGNYKDIDVNDVTVPTHYYKVILDYASLHYSQTSAVKFVDARWFAGSIQVSPL